MLDDRFAPAFADASVATPDTQEAALIAQAQRLERQSAELVRRATWRGAGVGAMAGCGVAALAGATSADCVSGAVVGGAVGAAMGNAIGREKARQRIDLNRVFPVLSEAGKQSAALTEALPNRLRAQDDELARLQAQRDRGEITPDAFEARRAEIAAWRVDVAQALTASAERMRMAQGLFTQARDQGQPGMGLYLSRAERLEQQATSARSGITLL